ncbi:MAG: PHB depolymerase family esterase [Sphingomonas bacterium]|nr:PHB depolymerase family esterase [Sphingomonas bacterium]
MRGLGNTVLRLTAIRRAGLAAMADGDGRLTAMTGFGPNPGALDARIYVPDDLPANAPLVVVLHGCTQNAAVYDKGSGWSKLADRHGFALLYPEQRRANNHNLCFNWYAPADARRGDGEARSIARMIENMVAEHRLDASRIFVTGLSAGGAMTAVMLAAYPDLFAGGAIIAGLPFASANTLPEALERMRGSGGPSRIELAKRAKAAAPQRGAVPTLSVWHGTRDMIVDAANAVVIVDQWRDLHGLGETRSLVDRVDGHRREVWHDGDGRAVIEKYDIEGMGHGTPLATRGNEPCGTAGPHMLEANICSTSRIAESWGLTGTVATKRAAPAKPIVVAAAEPPRTRAIPVTPRRPTGVGAVIEDALRAAGLMR